MFKIPEYLYIIEFYRKDLKVGEWVLVIIAIIAMIILLGLIVLLFVFLIKKVFKFRMTLVEQESMLQEIGELNKEVATLVEEKEKILAMKVSQLGLSPSEEASANVTEAEATEEETAASPEDAAEEAPAQEGAEEEEALPEKEE